MKEVTLEGVPAAGEPLEHQIAEENQELLETTIQERIERQRARLTRREKFFLSRRWKWLQKQLNKAGYNQLIVDRWECYQRYEELTHALKNEPTRELRKEYLEVIERGKVFNQKLEALQLFSEEFDHINDRLKAHDELLAWEKEDRENFRAFTVEARTWENQLIAAFRQSPRLHHRGTDNQGKEFIRTPKIREIIVKDDRVLYHIKTTGQNAIERLFGRWHSALPYGVDVASLVSDDTLENLSTACNRVVTVERSQRGTNLFYVISRLDSSDGIPNKVLYQKIIDWYPTGDHSKTPWCAGVTNDRKIEWYNFEDIPHVLIAGATQGGKSNHVNSMIATMVTMNTPHELRLMLVDLKGGIEFTHWRGLQHQLRPMLTTTNEVLEGLRWLRSIMERRLDAFESIKAKNLTSYNDKAKDKLPRIICVIDEMATLIGLGTLTQELHTEMRVLSSQGRAVGIHLLLCTQHSSVDVLPGWVKTNMSLRVSAKMPSIQSSMVILDSGSAAMLPNVAGRMVFSSGRSEIIAQSPLITDDQIAMAIRTANAFTKPNNTEFEDSLPDPVPEEKFTRNDVLRYALDMNGKISANRIHDIVGNDVITLRKLRVLAHSIIDELEKGTICFEGTEYGLERQGRAYVLVPTERPVEQKNGNSMVAI